MLVKVTALTKVNQILREYKWTVNWLTWLQILQKVNPQLTRGKEVNWLKS